MAPVGVAILGAGIFAKEAHLPALSKLPSSLYSLKAVYSRSQESASSLASSAKDLLSLSSVGVYYDTPQSSDSSLAALLSRSDISAVIVVLPITTQPGIIRQALKAGKHVLSEKPIAPDVKTAKELIVEYEREYKPKNLVWRVAENFEAEPAFQKAGALVKEGKIGKVIAYQSKIINYIDKDSKWYKTPWRTIPDYQGGFLLDGGVHFSAALRTMLPESSHPTLLSSFASLHKSWLPPHDTIHVILRSPDKSSGIYELTFASPSPSLGSGNGYTITGSAGYLLATNVKGGIQITVKTVKTVKGDDGKEKDEESEEVFVEESVGVKNEVESFLKTISGQGGPQDAGLGEPRQTIKDVALIEAALNSEGSLIDLGALASV
ncbi:NAD P-binding protein [Gloeophyllum trabeum ATCC 11539]|uniref:NAD P-binding protein n=1 Tax=Gloeophyllum trabeum (strain ATCC 11539 / FP-39264 / Madison 617) TaxID=670483 RepID=S7REB1_GLOTA|nr:NAD P-binding protein [Gloeophyllum trabeum ATCC 11539]EPQ50814.1 NAD P-binding protein [Gloeophyllum trabeum ATCC 11539]